MSTETQSSFLRKLCILYGFLYLLTAYHAYDGIGTGLFSLISTAFLLWIAARMQTAAASGNTVPHFSPEVRFYAISGVIVAFANCLTDDAALCFLNHIGSFLLFCITGIKLFHDDRAWNFGAYTRRLCRFWIEVVISLPVPFQDWKKTHTKKRKPSPQCMSILCGLAIGIPLFIVVTALLSSADAAFSKIITTLIPLDAIADRLNSHAFSDGIRIVFSVCFYSLLLYCTIAALAAQKLRADVPASRQFPVVTGITILTMVDIVYVLFCVLQIRFLGIPIGPGEYAQQARSGFFELLFVAIINFLLVLLCNRHFSGTGRSIRILRITMTITCGCTFIMIASSTYRMLQYIQEYHLTFLRVCVLWFLAMLSFFMIGTTISIYRQHFNTFRFCLFVLTVFYIGLILSNVNTRIGHYNIAQFEKAAGESTSQPALQKFLPDSYTDSLAYADCLSDLDTRWGDRLSSENKQLIRSYFMPEDYEYTAIARLAADHSADLYQTKPETSVFSYKQYNFQKAASARLQQQYRQRHTH